MKARLGFLILGVLCLGWQTAQANSVTVNTSIGLTGLQIVPDPTSGGSLVILSSPTSTNASALDSTGASSANSDPVFSSASTGLADAAGLASGPALTGTASSDINLPDNFSGFANSTGQATIGIDPTSTLFGSFEITGVTNPNPDGTVNVTITAPLSVNQFLQTTGSGVSASSEVIFTLLLPDLSADPLLFYDAPFSIGPNQTVSTATTPSLVTTPALSLTPDTAYTFIASLDAESNGVSTPEPASLGLLLCALALCAVCGRRITNRFRPDGRS